MAESVIFMAWAKLLRYLKENDEFTPIVKNLRDDLKILMDLLNDSGLCDKKLEEGSTQHYLMSQAREIAHYVDVAIDTFISHAEIPKGKGLNELHKEIRSIQSWMTQVKNQAKEVKDLMKIQSNSRTDPGRVWIWETADLVGLEEDVKLLLDKEIFQRKTEFLSIMCIVGMGGIGKTTLASVLYNHADVAAHFEVRAWVHVSEEFNKKEVLWDLIGQLGLKDVAETTSDDYELEEMVYLHLRDRKYFIVLDDVWEKSNDAIDVISIFPLIAKASTLLITSRNKKINPWCDGSVYEMKLFDPTQSWELFTKKVFIGDRRCPKHLEKIGRQIVAKCEGLPLAIQEAAKKLREKTRSELREEAESKVWEDFLEAMDLSETTETLESSYLNLDRSLKPCFLSLGFFKEGTTMRAQKLVHLWVAGEMVSNLNMKTFETNGRRSIKNLISECLIMVKERSADDRVRSCDVNYNLHRLAVKKAEEDIRFEVLAEKTSNNQSSCKPRHRAICCSREKFNYSPDRDRHLASLVFQGGGNFDANPTYWKSLKLLKVLDWEGFGLKSLPIPVEKLISLKYLGLRNNYIRELPRKSDQLKKLEVLDIALNFMIEVPNAIWKMYSLRHLYMNDIICLTPLKIDALRNLLTLTYISVDNWKHESSSLIKMSSLCKLGIEEMDEKSDVRKLFASLAMLGNLEHLILRGFRFRSMPELQNLYILQGLEQLKLDGLLIRLPSAESFPPNISCLILVNSSLDEDPMPILEKLSELKYLKLRNAYSGKQMVISCHGFTELCSLCIEELWHLRSVQVEKGGMKQLEKLEIRNCPYLDTLPEEIGSMRKLKELKMVTTRRIATMIRKSNSISKIREVDIQS